MRLEGRRWVKGMSRFVDFLGKSRSFSNLMKIGSPKSLGKQSCQRVSGADRPRNRHVMAAGQVVGHVFAADARCSGRSSRGRSGAGQRC